MSEPPKKKCLIEEVSDIQNTSREISSSCEVPDADAEAAPDPHVLGMENAFDTMVGNGQLQSEKTEDDAKPCSNLVSTNSALMFRRYWERNLELNNEYLLAVFGPMCPIITKITQTNSEPPHTLITANDVHGLYVRMLQYRQSGRYREAFIALRPTLPFYNNNHMVWTRMAEICIFELYEETWELNDIYVRVFAGKERTYSPSLRKQVNEVRQRHPELNIRYAQISSYLAFTLCKFSMSPITCLTATQNHAFLMLKMRKYRESLDASNYFLKNTEANANDEVKMKASTDQIEHIQLFKAEAKYYLGKYDRAIEYSHRVQLHAECDRLKMRAEMILAMSYLKKGNFRRSYQYVLNLVATYRLDDVMVENVALFGISIANKMRNYKMLKEFISLLQNAVL